MFGACLMKVPGTAFNREMGVGQNQTTRGLHVLVFVSIWVPFWVPIFDPHPNAKQNGMNRRKENMRHINHNASESE